MFQEVLRPGATSRRASCACEARHPTKGSQHHARGLHHGSKAKHAKKKRDISTSFRKGPVPRPLVNTPQQLASQEDEPMIGIPPPASVNLLGGVVKDNMPAGLYPAQQPGMLSQPEAITGLSLGEPCRIGRAAFEPVVAAAAVTAMPTQELGFALDSPSVSSLDSPSDSSADSMEDADGMLWADADPLAALDRVLDSLLVVPTMPTGLTSTPKPSSASAATSTSNPTSSSLLADVPASTAAPKKKPASTISNGASSKSAAGSQPSVRPSRSYMQALSAAAAAPAVTVIHCETEYERELEAAAALQQLLVVKVESSQNLLQRASDRRMRFQAHPDLNSGFGFLSSASSSGIGAASSNSSNTADVLASMGVQLGSPASTSSSSNNGTMMPSSIFGASSSSSSGEPFSPVHAWFKQLATQYAHSAAAASRLSPVRFLSLQSDSPRARAVCRRLGVSAPLAVVLVDAASGRKLQEVCGAKIEQELPNGLLYFGGSDPHGVQPAEQLKQISTEAELEAVKSSSLLSVVAFHVHAAPPCIRSYARMHAIAQQYAGAAAGPCVAFGVMDVDVVAEGAAVSSKLGLPTCLPTYVVYRAGEEVARLSSSPDRRRLGEVLAQQVAAASQHI